MSGYSFTSSFTYGLLVGQLSVLVVIIVFIRFFIFSDIPAQRKDYPSHLRQRQQAKISPTASASISTILEKTYYNVDMHPAESVDWFTVLIAQTIGQVRDDAKHNDNILKTLDSILNKGNLPDFLDSIKVTELNLGDDYPIFSNCRIGQNIAGNLEAEIDVDLTDTLTLGIETRLLLNLPKALFAYLPVSLSVSIVRFSGKLTVSLRNVKEEEEANGEGPSGTYLTFSFSPDYRIEFAVKSLVGARSRLQDVPKISELVQNRLRKWFTDRCVSPRYQQIRLPNFWPRSKTTKQRPVNVDSASTKNGPSGSGSSASGGAATAATATTAGLNISGLNSGASTTKRSTPNGVSLSSPLLEATAISSGISSGVNHANQDVSDIHM